MKFINRPHIELEEEELNLIIAAMELFSKIGNEAYDEGYAYKTIEIEADKIASDLSDFIELYVE